MVGIGDDLRTQQHSYGVVVFSARHHRLSLSTSYRSTCLTGIDYHRRQPLFSRQQRCHDGIPLHALRLPAQLLQLLRVRFLERRVLQRRPVALPWHEHHATQGGGGRGPKRGAKRHQGRCRLRTLHLQPKKFGALGSWGRRAPSARRGVDSSSQRRNRQRPPSQSVDSCQEYSKQTPVVLCRTVVKPSVASRKLHRYG
jgi:hypothetical protein